MKSGDEGKKEAGWREEGGDRNEGSSSVGEPLVTQGRILTAAQISMGGPHSLHPSS